MNLDKIDLKNVHKIVGKIVDGIHKKVMKGKTPDEFAQEGGFDNWMEYAAWSRHTGGDYHMMEMMLKSKWKEQDPEEFARQKKIESDQRTREHSYISLPPEAWPTSFIGNKKKKWQPVHKSNFTAEQLEKVYDDFGISGEPVEYRWG